MTTGRVAGLVLVVGLAFFAAAATRVAVSGARELSRGQAALAAGKTDEGVAALGRAARWYLPGLGAHREARELLMAWAARREADGNIADALTSLRHVRGSILGSRWLVVPDADLLAAANDRIAALMALQDKALRGDTALDVAAHRALLERDATPPAGRSALAVLMFIAWLATTIVGLWRGVRPEGGVRGRVLVTWAAVSLALLATWVGLLASL